MVALKTQRKKKEKAIKWSARCATFSLAYHPILINPNLHRPWMSALCHLSIVHHTRNPNIQAICSFSLCIYVAENFHFLLNKYPHKFKLFFSASQNLFVISVSGGQLGCEMANYYHHESSSSSSPLPLHLCFFLGIMFMFLGFSWYVNYESTVESVVDQIKMYLMLSPLVLLLAVHWFQSSDDTWMSFLFPAPERDSFHRAGSSPWGVALLLVLLMFMISYQSSLKERWFPLLSR